MSKQDILDNIYENNLINFQFFTIYLKGIKCQKIRVPKN